MNKQKHSNNGEPANPSFTIKQLKNGKFNFHCDPYFIISIQSLINFLSVFIFAAWLLTQPSFAHNGIDHIAEDEDAARLAQDYAPFDVASELIQAPARIELHQKGSWGAVLNWPHIPVSAANLPDGRILTWASNQPNAFPGGRPEYTYATVWDPQNNTFLDVPHNSHDMFCSHQVVLEDGRIFVSGGRNHVRTTSVFNADTNTWSVIDPMNRGRWYPTSVALSDGGVLTSIGSSGGRYPEIWRPNQGWKLLTGIDLQAPILDFTSHYEQNWWPYLSIAPDGSLVHYGPTPNMHRLTTSGNGTITALGQLTQNWYPKHGASVIYDEGKIILAGGAISGSNKASTNKTLLIDINGATPVVNEIAPMLHRRKFQNAVPLPNGEVLMIGGNTSGVKFNDSGTVLLGEIWNPETQNWRETAPMSAPRNYHSVALLLVDGRVLSGGGGLCGGCSANHQNAQVFSPPYLFDTEGNLAQRPEIQSAPKAINNGHLFDISATPGIAKFSLIKMSSTTHAVNTDARYVNVPFTEVSSGQYHLTSHSNVNVLTPGYYMLFALNAQGVPSIAEVIQVNKNIVPDNFLPFITQLEKQNNTLDDSINIQILATDKDGDSLTYTAQNLPDGLSIHSSSGLISGSPTTAALSKVTITVTDIKGGASIMSFDWDVSLFKTGTGNILREWWTGIGGNPVTNLTSNINYPDNPTGSQLISSFEAPSNWADNYGTRIRGYIYPPVNGEYTFWIASDDNGQLWLSTDDTASNASQIAHVPGWSSSRQWNKFAQQKSQVIQLQAGVPYYIEALQKEGGGGDNLAVAWQIPGSTGPTVIAGSHLSPVDESTIKRNLALNKATAQSSTYGSGVSDRAVDDNTNGRYTNNSVTHTHNDTNAWWQVDLGTVSSIDEIKIWNRTDCCSNRLSAFYVFVSDTPFTSTSLANTRAQSGVSEYFISGNAGSPSWINVARTGRYMRIQLSGRNYLSLAEVQVIGSLAVANQAPTIASPGNQTHTLNTPVSLAINASDANGDTLSFSATGLPLGLSLNSASGTITGSPITVSQNNVTISVNDGNGGSDSTAFIWNIIALQNRAPTVNNPGIQNNTTGSNVNLAIQASDPDGDSLSFSATGLPLGLSLNSASGVITGSPTAVSHNNVTLTVNDGNGGSDSVSFVWNITSLQTGTGKILREWWTGIGGYPVTNLTSNINYPDNPTGSQLISSFEAPTNWGSNYGTRIRGFIYPPVSGDYTFWIASDDNGQLWLSTDDTASNASQIAHVPGWSSSRQWHKYSQQKSQVVQLQAGVPYYIEALQKEVGGGDNLAVAWQIPGTNGPTVIAGSYLSPVDNSIPNRAPTVNNPGTQNSATGSSINLTIQASDPDGDILSFSAIGLPVGLSLNSATGIITGSTTTLSQNNVTISVNDGNGGSDSISFVWNISNLVKYQFVRLVAESEVNGNPWTSAAEFNVLDATGNRIQRNNWSISTDSEELVGENGRAINAIDGNTSTIWHTEWFTSNPRHPHELIINMGQAYAISGFSYLPRQSGAINGTIKDYSFYVSSDGINWGVPVSRGQFTNDRNEKTQLIAQNQAPFVSNPGAQIHIINSPLNLTINASDPDGDPITFSATSLPPGLVLDTTMGIITGSPSISGNYNTHIEVKDDKGGSATTSFSWTINNPVIPPISLSPITTAPVEVNSPVVYQAAASGGGSRQYKWNFGDGSAETNWLTESSVNHSFTNPGRFIATLTVKGSNGETVNTSFLQAVHQPLTARRPQTSMSVVYEIHNGNERLWNVNPDNDTVSVFDISSDNKLAEINVGDEPRSLAIAPDQRLWVVNKQSASISVINPETLIVDATWQLAPGSQPYSIVFDSLYNQAYITLEAMGQIKQLNASDGQEIASLDAGKDVRHLALNHDGTQLFASRFITPPLPDEATATPLTTVNNVPVGGEVLLIDTTDLSINKTIILQHSEIPDAANSGRGIPNYLGATVISPDGLSAWVPSKQDNIKRGMLRDGNPLTHDSAVRSISSKINLTNASEDLQARIDHDDAGIANSAAFGPYGNYLFIALEGSREVAMIDVFSGEEVVRFDTGRAPQGLALSPDGLSLYVHNFMQRSVSVHDLTEVLSKVNGTVTLLSIFDTVANEKLSAQVLLGKQHFYDARDPRLALEKYLSCASCHNEGDQDGRTWDFTGFGEGLRNTIDLRGRAGTNHGPLHWSANFDEVQDFEGQIRNFSVGSGLMADVDFHTGTRSEPLGDIKAGISTELDALASYVASLDKFARSPHRNNDDSLTNDAVLGREVFKSENCSQCHSAINFSDSAAGTLHDIGTIKASSGNRLNNTLTGIDTPTLRGVWSTAPYLHDGSATTLSDAITAHNGITLNAIAMQQLSHYLQQIDGLEPEAPKMDTTPVEIILDNPDASYSDNWPTSTFAPGFLGDNYQYHAGDIAGSGLGALGNPIDNLQASFIGTWPISNSINQYYATNYQYHDAGTGANTATWQTNVNTPGSYDIYVSWTAHASRASNAKYTIHHSTGTDIVIVNQRQNGGQWNRLGTFTLDSNSRISLSDDADGYIIADAVTVLPAGTPPIATAQGETATWSLGISTPGSYDVFAQWPAYSDRASDAKYTIHHSSGKETVSVNQQQNGGQWNLLGSYVLDSNSSIDLSSLANGYVIADGVRVVSSSP